ncbi:MAG TPA: DUF2460 domain-containing protein [Stellaceae bacterium]|jgi:uncharacterized protein (TIGR02217 family)|nr:DUF2460 domain-containing protein [Stellaceae bacterium]
MTAIFPTLPGLSWSVSKQPRFATRIQRAVSGRELRALDQPNPIWSWTLTYSLLRDGGLYDELRTLMGFFLDRQGAFAAFLYADPTDNAVVGQALGTGDGSTTAFQLVRTMGGFAEPVTAPNAVADVYVNGVVQSPGSYSVDGSTGLVTFTAPPPASEVVSADFTYYFRVRFADDAAEFENFMFQLWSLRQVKLQSVLL